MSNSDFNTNANTFQTIPGDHLVRVHGSEGKCDLSGLSSAERSIVMAESGGDPNADNPSSTAFGLGQLLIANRKKYMGDNYASTDCGAQIGAFRSYVKDRYGTAEKALAFRKQKGWY